MRFNLLIAFISLFCTVSQAAASGATLDLGAATERSEGSVTVPIVLSGGAGSIASVSMDIGFDAKKISVATDGATPPRLAVLPGPAAKAAGKTVVQGLPAPGLLRLGVFNPANNSAIGDGVVAYVTFVIAPGAGAPLVLTNLPDASDAKGNPVKITGSGQEL